MPGRTLRLMGLGMVATAGAGFLSFGGDDELRSPPRRRPTTSAWSSAAAAIRSPGSGYVGFGQWAVHRHSPANAPQFPRHHVPRPLTRMAFTRPTGYPLTACTTIPQLPQRRRRLFRPEHLGGPGRHHPGKTRSTPTSHAGNTSTVFGYSQSAIIAGPSMQQLDPTNTPGGGSIPQDDLQFLLIADPNNPNGGLLSRFDGFRRRQRAPSPTR